MLHKSSISDMDTEVENYKCCFECKTRAFFVQFMTECLSASFFFICLGLPWTYAFNKLLTDSMSQNSYIMINHKIHPSTISDLQQNMRWYLHQTIMKIFCCNVHARICINAILHHLSPSLAVFCTRLKTHLLSVSFPGNSCLKFILAHIWQSSCSFFTTCDSQ